MIAKRRTRSFNKPWDILPEAFALRLPAQMGRGARAVRAATQIGTLDAGAEVKGDRALLLKFFDAVVRVRWEAAAWAVEIVGLAHSLPRRAA